MMSKPRRAVVASVLASLVLSGSTAADVDPDVRDLQQAVLDLKEQLERQEQRLQEQADRFTAAEESKDAVASEESTEEDASGAGYKFSTFLKAVEVHSWINVNYTYNSRGNGNDHSIGQNSNTGFHDDNHTVQVDQLWFRFDKPVSEESRAGFHADIAFGETARSNIGFAGNDAVTVYSAYLSYLAPLGFDGIRIDAGELWTLLGAEVIPASENLNITRGLVWNLQPVSNTGVLATTFIGPVSVSAGFVNAVLSDTAIDSDRNKALTGQVAYRGDSWRTAGSLIWGSRQGELEDSTALIDPDGPADGPFFPVNNDRNEFDLAIFDLVVAGDPTENTTVYMNFDYVWSHPGHGVPNRDTYGISVAGRYAMNNVAGIAMRFDVVVINPSNARSENEYSLTTTLDYLVADHLTLRGEARFDWGIDGKYHKASDPYSFPGGLNHQNLFLVEAIYSF